MSAGKRRPGGGSACLSSWPTILVRGDQGLKFWKHLWPRKEKSRTASTPGRPGATSASSLSSPPTSKPQPISSVLVSASLCPVATSQGVITFSLWRCPVVPLLKPPQRPLSLLLFQPGLPGLHDWPDPPGLIATHPPPALLAACPHRPPPRGCLLVVAPPEMRVHVDGWLLSQP